MTFLVKSATGAREQFETLGAAITKACGLIEGGTPVQGIAGSDGFVMAQQDVELECSRRSETAIAHRQQVPPW